MSQTNINGGLSEKTKMSVKKKIVIISLSVLAFIVLAAGSTLVYMYYNWRPLGKEVNVEYKTKKEDKSRCMNFLMCGIDFEDNSTRGHLTDIMMIISFDIDKNTISMLQLPRDTYVGADETVTGKLNAIYGRGESWGKGGIEGLIQYINETYDIPIDHYATVNMTAFRNVVDGIGGVEMDVPFTFTLEGVTVEAGKQVLNGEQAEKFVRKRHGNESSIYLEGDNGRMKMQRLFIAALAKQLKNTPMTELAGMIKDVIGDITTDMTVSEVVETVTLMQKVKLDDMIVEMASGEAYKAQINGSTQYIYILHADKFSEKLNKYFRPYRGNLSQSKIEKIEELEAEMTEQGYQRVSGYDNTIDDLKSLLRHGAVPGTHKDDDASSKSTASDIID